MRTTTGIPIAAAAPALGSPSVAARVAELLGLFVLLPLLVRWNVVAAPRLVVLGVATAGCAVVLRRDPTFEWRRLFALGDLRRSLPAIARRGAIAASAILALVLVLRPAGLLSWPRRDPGLWLAGVALYPFLSASLQPGRDLRRQPGQRHQRRELDRGDGSARKPRGLLLPGPDRPLEPDRRPRPVARGGSPPIPDVDDGRGRPAAPAR